MRGRRSLAKIGLYLSLPIIFAFLILARPPIPFYVLPLAPIALAAMLHGFVEGTLVAVAAMAGAAVLIALDPDAARRAKTLQEAWPILSMYLAVGPLTGWLATRERERERRLTSAQRAIATQHARLFESERRWSRHLAAISDAGREIAASLDLDRTLRLVMDKAVQTLPMDAGALFQFDTKTQAYRVAVSHNLSADHVARITFAFDEGVPGWVAKYRQALIIPDAAADVRVHPHVLEDGVRSVLAIPLVAREQVVGVLNLYCKTNMNTFDAEALRLAQVYADQAAIAIENARLVAELRRAAAELEARVEERTRQLRETQAQIIRAEKLAAAGRLAASIAHEVNNPLQAIALQLELIANEGLTEPARARLATVQEELTRIASIVQRLLDFQRPTPGERALHHVSALLDDVLALADKQLQRQGISVVRWESADLPPVLAVGDQIKQVFLNLVLNAVEAMPDGGRLGIGFQQSNGAVSITFTDSGVGMAPEVLEQVFEPFFSTKANGTGLGLAVSHEIVTHHGGSLEASSIPGQGSTFTLRLPSVRGKT